MSTSQRRLVLTASSIVGVLFLSACTAGAGGAAAPTSTSVPSDQRLENVQPALPEGRVIATGTVLDTDGEAQLCLGPVAESFPPQCAGIPLDGWTWDGVDGSESSGSTTWGTYAVYGTYDGERYAVTDPPIMLALYDPIRPEDPTGGVDGGASDADLAAVQDDIAARLGHRALSLHPERGYVWLQVVWDDGTLHKAADAEFGDDVVIVTSSLREID